MPTIRWIPVAQDLPRPRLPDAATALCTRLDAAPALARIRAGSSLAVAVGSRGIPDVGNLVGEVVGALRRRGADPFVVPAMGTHGGLRPEEQEAVLAHLGVTAMCVGAPVLSRPAVTVAGVTSSGIPVWVDAAAWAADALVPVNRVKPHTAFRGPVESGPSKLLAVGLGKGRSAEELHRRKLDVAIPEVAAWLLSTGKVPFGVALVENPFGEIAGLKVLEPATWLEAEEELLHLAWTLYPRLPWAHLDLLVVEQIGKDISGTGMDVNVIGLERRFPGCGAEPRIERLVALDLTRGSRGNATGVGYADVVTRALVDRVDWEATRTNCRATGFAEAGLCPTVARDEDEAVALALSALSPPAGAESVRAVRLRDTGNLARFHVSPALAQDLPPGVHRACG